MGLRHRVTRPLMLAGLTLLLISFFLFYADNFLGFTFPDQAFLIISIVWFQLIVVGRLVTSTWKELILLAITDAAFVAAGLSILSAPSFSFGRWDYFLFMTLLFTAFVTSGFLPIKKVETRYYGVASAFVLSFFFEMFGFPLTLFLIDRVFAAKFPLTGRPGLEAAHLWTTFGLIGGVFAHALSAVIIAIGVSLVILGHVSIHSAKGRIVTWGIYRCFKHPQYLGIILITGGMLIEYPTLVSVAMWGLLITMYALLARRESREIAIKPGEPPPA